MRLAHALSLAVIGLALAWGGPSAVAAGPLSNDAAKFIKSLGEDTIEVLSAPGESEAERHQRYRDLLERGFAVKTIARFAIGRYWRAATPEQQDEYLALFRDFVLETYASRLDGYSGERFEILAAQALDEKDTIVSTKIYGRDDKPPVRVDYRVRKKDDGYKIIDVMVEGVSLITTQRSEFAAIVNRKGVEGLLALLREKTGQKTARN